MGMSSSGKSRSRGALERKALDPKRLPDDTTTSEIMPVFHRFSSSTPGETRKNKNLSSTPCSYKKDPPSNPPSSGGKVVPPRHGGRLQLKEIPKENYGTSHTLFPAVTLKRHHYHGSVTDELRNRSIIKLKQFDQKRKKRETQPHPKLCCVHNVVPYSWG